MEARDLTQNMWKGARKGELAHMAYIMHELRVVHNISPLIVYLTASGGLTKLSLIHRELRAFRGTVLEGKFYEPL